MPNYHNIQIAQPKTVGTYRSSRAGRLAKCLHQYFSTFFAQLIVSSGYYALRSSLPGLSGIHLKALPKALLDPPGNHQ